MSSLFTELKRRNIVRVAAAYLLVGWVVAVKSPVRKERGFLVVPGKAAGKFARRGGDDVPI